VLVREPSDRLAVRWATWQALSAPGDLRRRGRRDRLDPGRNPVGDGRRVRAAWCLSQSSWAKYRTKWWPQSG